jgi:hypothetical protein
MQPGHYRPLAGRFCLFYAGNSFRLPTYLSTAILISWLTVLSSLLALFLSSSSVSVSILATTTSLSISSPSLIPIFYYLLQYITSCQVPHSSPADLRQTFVFPGLLYERLPVGKRPHLTQPDPDPRILSDAPELKSSGDLHPQRARSPVPIIISSKIAVKPCCRLKQLAAPRARGFDIFVFCVCDPQATYLCFFSNIFFLLPLFHYRHRYPNTLHTTLSHRVPSPSLFLLRIYHTFF